MHGGNNTAIHPCNKNHKTYIQSCDCFITVELIHVQNGVSPLFVATAMGHSDIVKTLKRNGACND